MSESQGQKGDSNPSFLLPWGVLSSSSHRPVKNSVTSFSWIFFPCQEKSKLRVPKKQSKRKHDVSVRRLGLFFRITRLSKDLESADASSTIVLFVFWCIWTWCSSWGHQPCQDVSLSVEYMLGKKRGTWVLLRLGGSWLGVLKITLMQLVAYFVSGFLLHIQTIFLVCNNMGIAVLSYDLRT